MRPNSLIKVPAKIEFAAVYFHVIREEKLKSILNMRSEYLKLVVVVPYVLRQ